MNHEVDLMALVFALERRVEISHTYLYSYPLKTLITTLLIPFTEHT